MEKHHKVLGGDTVDSENSDDKSTYSNISSDLNFLRICAKQLYELPDPKLSISELQAVLKWEIIPESATDIYKYAFLVAMFLEYLERVDLNTVDNKTRKLIDTTTKKIGISTAGDGRYGVLFAGLTGILTASLLYYFMSHSWIWTIASTIPSFVTAIYMSNTMDAQDRTGLSRVSSQSEVFANTLILILKLILIIEYGVPCITALWRLFREHLWKGFATIVMSPLLYTMLVDPRVQVWWIDAKLLSQFYCMALTNWINPGPQYAVRWFANAISIYVDFNFIALLLRKLIYIKPTRFVYPPQFDHRHKIRLLRLKRKNLFATVEMEFLEVEDRRLRVHSYDAISHVWGNEKQTEPITIHGCQFLVTPSVYSILYRCSSYFRPRLIWIDNLCINQAKEAEDEKISQIPKMRDIYDHARTVQIFLVKSSTGWLAVPFMVKLLMLYGSSKENFSAEMISLLLRAKMDRWVRAQIDALLDLLGNPWFERAG